MQVADGVRRDRPSVPSRRANAAPRGSASANRERQMGQGSVRLSEVVVRAQRQR